MTSLFVERALRFNCIISVNLSSLYWNLFSILVVELLRESTDVLRRSLYVLIERAHDQLVLVVWCIAHEWHHALLGGATMLLVMLVLYFQHLVATYLTRAQRILSGGDEHRTGQQRLLISWYHFELLALLIMTFDVGPDAVGLHVQIIF